MLKAIADGVAENRIPDNLAPMDKGKFGCEHSGFVDGAFLQEHTEVL